MIKTLNEAKKGQMLEITKFADNPTKCNSARFGIAEGQIIKCVDKMGPVIISKNQQILALGRNLSKKIQIRELKG